MDTTDALTCFTALGHPSRLAAVRELIAAGPAGLAAGELGARLDVRQNTLSANLNILLGAGLVGNERQGRTIRYFANVGTIRGLLEFLMQDCCGGRPDLCQPVIDEIATFR